MTNPNPPDERAGMVELVCRAMLAASRPNANPDDLTPAPRGTFGLIPKWRLYEHLARAAIAAMREPTPAMERAAFDVLEIDPSRGPYASGTQARNAVWDAMIDAALSQGSE